jgi:hypothetical protein
MLKLESRTTSFVLPLSLFCLENRICLSGGVQVVGAVWHVAMRIVAGGDLMQRIEDDPTSREPRWTVCQWFDLKTGGDGFLQFGLKTSGDGFFRFGLKIDGGFLS